MGDKAYLDVQLSYFVEMTNTADDIEEAIRLIQTSPEKAIDILSRRAAENRQVAFELQKDLEISTKKELTSTDQSNS